ncbi:RNA polymerase sigma factor [Flagellimonas sp.]|uniref:RNA polymerase sigma factor n=1 Tax=Flagellimonas sp. TaxID=2058762 RepID=UPI003B5B4DC8
MGQENFGDLSDKNLLSLIKEGNQMAFRQLYHRHWEGLYSCTINVLKDKGQTEDVLHEVFVNIWTKRDKLDIQNVKGYLFRAVRNQALMKIRNERFIDLHEETIRQLSLSPKAEQNLAESDLKFKIGQAAKSLPARCKAIFFMSRYQEYSINEIAQHFNISHRTVENQLHIALKHIRSTLGNVISLLLFFTF